MNGVALIKNNKISTIVIVPNDWTPPPGYTSMPESEAIEQNIPYEPPPPPSLESILDRGYTVTPENWILGMTEYDRRQFADQLVLLREAEVLGIVNPSTEIVIREKGGVSRNVTVGRLRQILVGYGNYYLTIWQQIQ